MKTGLLILLCLPLMTLGQTFIPDANFEAYLEANSMGNGIANDNYVTTSNINTVDTLMINGQNISDLTGIEDFTVLLYLSCSSNQLITLNLSQNTALIYLMCSDNQLTSLDVSQCLNLEQLRCDMNKLTSLDLSPNINFSDELYLSNNELSSLNIKNGKNYMIVNNQFSIEFNPNLTCVEVDDPVYSDATWLNIDNQHYFSNNCSGPTSIQEHSTNKEVIKITDVLGQEIPYKKNTPLFYIYDDGTVEKKIIIE